jgi:hypothetical protein
MAKTRKTGRTKPRAVAQSPKWKEHVERLHAMEKKLPEHLKTGLDVNSIKTPAKAAHYVKKAKAALRKVKIVAVPRPAEGSLNKHRPMPCLLSTQLLQFRELEMSLPEHRRTGIEVESLETEGQAAEYIRKMTARLHTQKASGKRKR